MKTYQNNNTYLCKHRYDTDDDCGQFCDLEEPVTPVTPVTKTKLRIPSMDSIPETMEHSLSTESFDYNNEEYTKHPIVNGIKNLMNTKQYIYETVWETREKKHQLLYHAIWSSVVIGVVIYTFH